ncbi:hypothetical protein VKT23_010775 [Stygiomarasmius scandens]|uniref:F-box domain-containing protein n=1 Tax=Marasmiellus scandens TaxID=2682957 RepID=A0ABR1JFT1_9AGAR
MHYFPERKSPFPQELIDYIVDELAEDSNSLQACALTSRSFRRPSQRILFQLVSLEGVHCSIKPLRARGKRPTRCQRLYAILEASPHIAGLIRDLSFTGDYMDRWNDNALPLVLSRMTNIRRFFFSSDPETSSLLNFSAFPNPVKDALFALLQSHSVEHIGIHGAEFSNLADFCRVVSGGAGLKSLALFSVSLSLGKGKRSKNYDIPQFPPTTTSRLLSLTVFVEYSTFPNSLWDWFFGPRSPYSLDYLEHFGLVGDTPNELHILGRVLAANNGSMKELNITLFDEHGAGFPDTLDLSSPHTINIGFTIHSSNPLSCQKILDSWCRSFESSRDLDHLKTLNICIFARFDDLCDYEFTAPGWKRMDRLLSSVTSGLAVKIDLKALETDDDDSEDDEDDNEDDNLLLPPRVFTKLKEALPLTNANGHLKVSQTLSDGFDSLFPHLFGIGSSEGLYARP